MLRWTPLVNNSSRIRGKNSNTRSNNKGKMDYGARKTSLSGVVNVMVVSLVMLGVG